MKAQGNQRDTPFAQVVRPLSSSVRRALNKKEKCKRKGCDNLQSTGTGYCIPCKRQIAFDLTTLRRKQRTFEYYKKTVLDSTEDVISFYKKHDSH